LILLGAACFRRKSVRKKLFYITSKILKIFSCIPYYSKARKGFYRFIVRKSDYAYADGIMKDIYLKIIKQDLSDEISQVQVPTKIIWGEKDKIKPIKEAEMLEQKIKSSQLEIIPDVGHSPHLRVPEKLSEIILRFLKESGDNICLISENNRNDWNKFLIKNNGKFLQSFEWGEFQKSLNKKVWRLKIFQKNCIVAEAQIIRETFPIVKKSILYIPFGPVFRSNASHQEKEKCLSLFLRKLKEIAKKENAIFLTIEALYSLIIPKEFLSCVSQKRHQPQKTLVINLEKKEKEIFMNFFQKVRYNIRLSERKGVKTEIGNKYIGEFYELMKKTKQRDNFQSFDEKHYKKLFDFNSKDFRVVLSTAKYKEKIIASTIYIFWGKEVISLHSASDDAYRALKAPALLRWKQMLEAKKEGYKEYDFWGIDEKKWPGLTYFKKSFGGKEMDYPEGKDIIFQRKWYKIYKILSNIRKNR
ncbi:MAG: peptidoglycan bridge formation glycyltransferase FemA/FemB family protein, partial [Patescibacteria group bacterium]|nr:peptidoglycan bridge formation glycyltransferase FemA/FemB family protein [Patescibacteria group bacterium]